MLAAFLVEYSFYLVPSFPETRKRWAGATLVPALLLSVLLPYLTCYLPFGQFTWISLIKLTALGLALSLWYVVLPATAASDLLFLALVGAVLLSSYLTGIYPDPYPRLKMGALLGRIAVFRMTVMVLVLQRRMPETGYGLIPNRREWAIGTVHYLCFLPVAAVLAFALKAVRLGTPAPLWKTVAIFLGFLWVVALFEEFLFRGVLQQWLEQWTGSRTAALLMASAVFGSVHLWFRGFPNWRWAIIAGVLGWFCGHARNQAGGIRAGVVTHALVVATWRGFFT